MSLPLTMNDLTVHLPDDQQLAIVADWRWLIGPERHPLLVTARGHAFLHDMTDGSITLLDTAAGALVPIAEDVDDFRALLRDEAFVHERFEVEAVAGLIAAGQRRAEGEVYGVDAPVALADHFSATGRDHARTRSEDTSPRVGEER